jgi:hypothetical protein
MVIKNPEGMTDIIVADKMEEKHPREFTKSRSFKAKYFEKGF